MPPIVRAQYGRLDYSAIPELLRAAEALGFGAMSVDVKQDPTGARVIVEFAYSAPEAICT
jgi:hypothetical protein